MKVLLVNGSGHEDGTTMAAFREMTQIFEDEGISWEIIQLGNDPIRDCTACQGCSRNGNRCVFSDDIVNEVIDKAEQADGFIFGTPVYYAHPSGRILSFLDRIFYAGSSVFAHKPGAAVACARRGGTTATLDVLNKYFTIAQMPLVSSTYWNMLHGANAQDAAEDLEGLQTMRNLAKNMCWLMKCIEAGKNQGIEAPKAERGKWTNFIR